MNFVEKARISGDPRSEARKPKTPSEGLGQVFTPPRLARRMLEGLRLSEASAGARLLDPCVGPATFPKALEALGSPPVVVDVYDIDEGMVANTLGWARHLRFNLSATTVDYLDSVLQANYDFAILNPPYVRQEWIANKDKYRRLFRERYGVEVPGTSNLYVYFMVKALADLKVGGRMACIVYDSWQTTLFGKWLKAYLLSSCRSLKVETVTDLPFAGHLIDATIIFAEKGSGTGAAEPAASSAEYTTNLRYVRPLDELFHTKRGLRLKQADFFLSDLQGVADDGALPFIKKVGLVRGFAVPKDHPESVLLLSPTRSDARTVAALDQRLAAARAVPSANVSILTWWRERPESWALHSGAPWAPLLFNYYLRRRPRHIFNPERFYSDNFYGLTPRDGQVPELAWLAALNGTLSVVGVLERARNQGAGLAKLQLFEYRAARVLDLQTWSISDLDRIAVLGGRLLSEDNPERVIPQIDNLVADVLACKDLGAAALACVLDEVDRRARRPKERD